MELRPSMMSLETSPFYISCNHQYQTGNIWFKNSKMGKNNIGDLAKKMSKRANLEGRHTNHSARHTAVYALGKFQDTEVIQITGHKNVEGLKPYKGLDFEKQKAMSDAVTAYIAPSMNNQNDKENDALQMTKYVESSTKDADDNVAPPAQICTSTNSMNVNVVDLGYLPTPQNAMRSFSNCTFNGNVVIHFGNHQ